MDFPTLVAPRLSHSLRNWFLARTLIQPYFDKDFSTGEFAEGAKLAAVSVANGLAEGHLESVGNGMTPECLDLVKRNISLFSVEQREALKLSIDDLYFHFNYQIGIIMEDDPNVEGNSTRHVEITWVGHTFKDYFNVVEECGGNPVKIKQFMEEQGGPTVLNYRFIRDYTKGVEDSWTLNALNHFKLLDAV